MRCHFYENDNFKKNFNLRKKLKIFKINYMFVFNKYYAQKYNSFIKGKPIIIGSFKNNFHKKSNFSKKKEICLISSYRHFKDEQKIYASETSIVGSIGVRLDSYDVRSFFNKLGIKSSFQFQ